MDAEAREAPTTGEDRRGLCLPPLAAPVVACRNAHETYEKLNHLAEGTYGVVYRARDRLTQRVVAMKRIKLDDSRSGFPIQELREVRALRKLGQNLNVVNLDEVVVGRSINSVYLVMQYVEHDLQRILSWMRKGKTPRFSTAQIKCVLSDLLRGLRYIHSQWFMHRDIKPSNLLYGNDGTLKIGDFGLAREYQDPTPESRVVVEASGAYSIGREADDGVKTTERGPYTGGVVTLWYRAPEVLLGSEEYQGPPLDMWSAGCVFAEIILCNPLIQGTGMLDQITKMLRLFGTPNEECWPGFEQLPHVKRTMLPNFPLSVAGLREKIPTASLSDIGFDLLCKLLEYDPSKRISGTEALQHAWLSEERPPATHRSVMPGWAELHEK